jgi:NAD(P)-dependent dehydrogenase (short-subunit alcohol dehydrogenase family)
VLQKSQIFSTNQKIIGSMASIPSDSKCLVVGATNPTSIGFITALALLQAGAAHVTVVGRSQPKLDHAITALLSKKKGKISGVLGDLTQPESMEAVVQEASNNMGGLDVLVCCGGNGYSEYLGLDPADLQSYRTMQDVAVLSPMFLIEAAIPFLSKSVNPEGGTVVLVGSVSCKF